MTILTLPAPAKLNLFLHITGRRKDGYHLLQTLFQLLDYSDDITLSSNFSGIIRRVRGNANIPETEDLMVRAAHLLQSHCTSKQGVDLSIEKKIPMGGGLGGGSSNAATVLVGLNTLWQCGLKTDQLMALGLQLGADVPVFIKGYSAWAEGIGEILTPITLPEYWYLVIAPKILVSTSTIFAEKSLTRNCQAIRIATFLAGATQNVFEPIVRKRYPDIDHLFELLSEYELVRLTGTGACVFVRCDSEQIARHIRQKLPSTYDSFVAKGVNQSPLVDVYSS